MFWGYFIAYWFSGRSHQLCELFYVCTKFSYKAKEMSVASINVRGRKNWSVCVYLPWKQHRHPVKYFGFPGRNTSDSVSKNRCEFRPWNHSKGSSNCSGSTANFLLILGFDTVTYAFIFIRCAGPLLLAKRRPEEAVHRSVYLWLINEGKRAMLKVASFWKQICLARYNWFLVSQ